jgi:hypothetical protein
VGWKNAQKVSDELAVSRGVGWKNAQKVSDELAVSRGVD